MWHKKMGFFFSFFSHLAKFCTKNKWKMCNYFNLYITTTPNCMKKHYNQTNTIFKFFFKWLYMKIGSFIFWKLTMDTNPNNCVDNQQRPLSLCCACFFKRTFGLDFDIVKFIWRFFELDFFKFLDLLISILVHFSNSRTFELGSKLDLIPRTHPQMLYCMGTKIYNKSKQQSIYVDTKFNN